jgi:hypothetical protein
LVETVFKDKLLIFNIHAGIDEAKLVEYYKKMVEEVENIKK